MAETYSTNLFKVSLLKAKHFILGSNYELIAVDSVIVFNDPTKWPTVSSENNHSLLAF